MSISKKIKGLITKNDDSQQNKATRPSHKDNMHTDSKKGQDRSFGRDIGDRPFLKH